MRAGSPAVLADGSLDGLEEFLCGVWKNLLGATGDLAESDFFALGGHSFLAIEVITELQTAFGIEVPFWLIFECPTPRLLAQRVAESQA
jgi:acyl carrier protein